jgi:uncharacterized membrane protein
MAVIHPVGSLSRRYKKCPYSGGKMQIGFYEILVILGILVLLALIIAVVVLIVIKLVSGPKDRTGIQKD